jgi:hypothetical protein
MSNELSARFPNASPSFLRLNGYANIPPVSQAPAAVAQCSVRDDAPPTRKTKKADSTFYLVRFTSFRSRLIDTDNLCEKYHCDTLRYAGILPDDSPDQARIETRQVKCAKGEERTLIEIYALQHDAQEAFSP